MIYTMHNYFLSTNTVWFVMASTPGHGGGPDGFLIRINGALGRKGGGGGEFF